jgi:DHA1 family tetracycline resistance protein-like MFS transporter
MKRSAAGAVFLSVVIDLVGFGIVLPLLPLYAEDLHATGTDKGLLIAAFSAMQFLFAPVWGRVSDRVGRRPVLLLGLAGSVVFYTVFAFADSLADLYAARIGAGICGATISTAAAYIADVTPPERRARGMALIGAAFGIGFTIGPILGFSMLALGKSMEREGAIDHAAARALPGIAAAGLSAISFAWTLLSVAEPPRRAALAPRRLLDLEAFRAARDPRAVAVLLLFSLLSVFSFANFESTLSLLLRHRFRYGEREMGIVFLFVGVTLALAQGLLVRRLATRLPERTLVRCGFVLMSGGLAGVAAFDALAPFLAGVAAGVVGFGMVTPSLSALVSRQADAARQGAMLGLAQSASSLGRILGPYVGNEVFDPEGHREGLVGPLLAPLFGDLAPHRRPYVLGAVLLAGLAAAAWFVLPPPPPATLGEGDAAGGAPLP